MKKEESIETMAIGERLPAQAAPVRRAVLGSAIATDGGVEASDYNDPVYFFLNWPASV
jgi:hypothetical protein